MEHNSCPSDLGLADNIKMSLQEKKRPFPRFLYITGTLSLELSVCMVQA